MDTKKVLGVGFLLSTQLGGEIKMFLIQELKDKEILFKKAGMLSFPLESYKEEDGNIRGTIDRLLKEEIGIGPEEVELLGICPKEFKLIPGESNISTMYAFGIFLGDPTQDFQPKTKDVAFAGWMTIRELLTSFIRIEVAPIVGHFMEHYYDTVLQRLRRAS